MSASKRTHCGAFQRNLVVLLALVALLVPVAVRGESLLLLYKADTDTTTQWQETIRQNTKKPAILSLNDNGDLMVKYGAMNVVLAYNPPEELHKQQEPVRFAMAVNQTAPTISGVSIKVNFSF